MLRELSRLLVVLVLVSVVLFLSAPVDLAWRPLHQATWQLREGDVSMAGQALHRHLHLAVGGKRPVAMTPSDLAPRLQGGPSEEICVVWYVQPDMDQMAWLLDQVLDTGAGGAPSHHFRHMYDGEGRNARFCRGHTLVVDICTVERLKVLGRRAQSKRIRRLGVYCLADEDSALDAKLFEGIHYGFHEYGLVEGAPHIMPVPLGPTVDFGLINPAVQATPSSFRFQGCMFKGRPSSDQRRRLYGFGRLKAVCNIVNTEHFKHGAPPHAFRIEMGAAGVCPCPRGVSYEQFRLWEALESGCIPVIGAGHPMPAILGGDHPLPTLSDEQWMSAPPSDLLDLVDRYGRPGPEADRKRSEISAWYRAYKAGVARRAAQLMLQPDDYLRSLPHDNSSFTTTVAAIPPAPSAVTCLLLNTRVDLPELSWTVDVAMAGLARSALAVRWLKDHDSPTTLAPDSPMLATCHALVVVHEGSSSDKKEAEARWARLLQHLSHNSSEGAQGPRRLGLVLLRVTDAEQAGRLLNRTAPVDLLLADADSIPAVRRYNAAAVLLPRGPRSGFGNHVGTWHARRPASRRALCAAPVEGALAPDKRLHADLQSICPLLDLRAIKPAKNPAYSAGHTRMRLLDSAVVVLPYTSSAGDWHVLWESLACGAIPVLTTDSSIYRELAAISGGEERLPLPAFGPAEWQRQRPGVAAGNGSDTSAVRAFLEGLKDEPDRLDEVQREVYAWWLGVKQWLARRVASALEA